MKIKALLVMIISIFLVFLIYLSTIDNKVYYLVLGDYLGKDKENSYSNIIEKQLKKQEKLEIYVNGFQRDDMRIPDVINQIESNEKILIDGKERTIKNSLIKADFVLLSVGSNDLFYKLDNHPPLTEDLYDRVDELIDDTEKLFELLKEYCKEDIFFLGYYNPYESDYDELIEYANTKLKKLTRRYEITFISTNSCVEGSISRNEMKLTNKENKCVSEVIKKEMNQKLFEHKVEY